MQHDHHFRETTGGVIEMRDVFSCSAPLPVFGVLAEALFLKRYMERFLAERNAVLKRVAESDRWKDLLPR